MSLIERQDLDVIDAVAVELERTQLLFTDAMHLLELGKRAGDDEYTWLVVEDLLADRSALLVLESQLPVQVAHCCRNRSLHLRNRAGKLS